jgi:hypothetical protein
MKLQSFHKKLKVPSCEIYDSVMSSLFVVLGVLNMRLAIRSASLVVPVSQLNAI